MIAVADLRVDKGGQRVCQVAELSVDRGEHIAVVGENGAGKTTLLRVMIGLERDFSGRCEVAIERRQRGYLHQHPLLFRGSVLDNVVYGLRARGQRRAEAAQLATRWLERFAIVGLAERSVEHLSGGEARRVALARALVLSPRLLLLDEPLAEMDEAGATQVAAVVAELEDTTVIIASPTTPPVGLVERIVEL